MENLFLHRMANRLCMALLLVLVTSLLPISLVAQTNSGKSQTSEMNAGSDDESASMDYYAVYNPTDDMLTFKKCVAKSPTIDGNTYFLLSNFLQNRGSITSGSIKTIVIDGSMKHYPLKSCKNLFAAYSSLVSIKGLENLNTENVTDMTWMFVGCEKIQGLDVSCLNTEKVTNMCGMFELCRNLQALDLSNFKTQNVTDMSSMFAYCSNLKSLDLTSFNTSNVTNMSSMFSYCSELKNIEMQNFNTAKVTDMTGMFRECSSLLSLDLTSFNTANVTEMGSMFSSCHNLISLDLANFDTSNVTSMYCMFDWCDKLESLDISNFNTSNVIDMQLMFYGCQNLKSIDVSSFNTAKVKRMLNMFGECQSIKELDISKFNTERVVNMAGLFYGCNNLIDLKLPKGINTRNVEEMGRMFRNCKKLKAIDLSDFNTASVTDMSNMFENCYELESLDLSNFNTVKTKYMREMFLNCKSLQSLDLTSFDTKGVMKMDFMFSGCKSLENVYVSDMFTFGSDDVLTYEMFDGCESLPNYNSSNIHGTMANYKTGYFKTYYKIGDEIHPLSGEELVVDELTLNDGEDFKTFAPLIASDATYVRKMENTWGTLCLPFAINTETIMNGCKLYRLEAISDEELLLKEIKDEDVAAGEPVLIKRNGSTASNISIDAQNANIVKEPIAGKSDENRLVGTFTTIQVPGNAYAIASDKFWLVSEIAKDDKSVWLKGMRAYVQPAEDSSSAIPSVLSITEGNTATSMEMLNATANGKAQIYDINGRKQSTLQKGLNIIRHAGTTQKVYIK